VILGLRLWKESKDITGFATNDAELLV